MKGVPNSCAVAAVVRSWKHLRGGGAPARIMAIVFDDGDVHAACTTESATGELFLYDERGSRHLAGASLQWSALAIARAAFGNVRTARWIGESGFPVRGRTRRLSPRECRNLPARLDHLLGNETP